MKAEIGFERCWEEGSSFGEFTGRLVLVVHAQSDTEGTALAMFAKRCGLTYDVSSGRVTFEEPAKPS